MLQGEPRVTKKKKKHCQTTADKIHTATAQTHFGFTRDQKRRSYTRPTLLEISVGDSCCIMVARQTLSAAHLVCPQPDLEMERAQQLAVASQNKLPNRSEKGKKQKQITESSLLCQHMKHRGGCLPSPSQSIIALQEIGQCLLTSTVS